MSEISGLNADVYFGGPEEPLPDWRTEAEDSDDPIEADEPDENIAALTSLYGYDPAWWEELEEQNPDLQFATADEPRSRPRDRRVTRRATQAGATIADEVRGRLDQLLKKKG